MKLLREETKLVHELQAKIVEAGNSDVEDRHQQARQSGELPQPLSRSFIVLVLDIHQLIVEAMDQMHDGVRDPAQRDEQRQLHRKKLDGRLAPVSKKRRHFENAPHLLEGPCFQNASSC